MALTGPQKNTLVAALKRYAYEPLGILLNSIDKSLKGIVGAGNGREQTAFAVVEKAVDDGWDIALIEAGHQHKPMDPDFAKLNNEIAASAATRVAGLSEYDADLVRGYAPFILRDDLRRYLKAIEPSGSLRILTVNGDRWSGKTYTKEFIYHLKESGHSLETIWIELGSEDDERVIVKAQDIIERIQTLFPALGDVPPHIEARFQDKKWADAARLIGDWLRGGLPEGDKPIWIIVDGFDDCILAEGAKELIQGIAARVANDLDGIRLILLGYDHDLPVTVYEETLDEPSGSAPLGEVLDFLHHLHVAAGFAGDEDALLEQLDEEVSELLSEIEMVPSSMREIGRRLGEKAAEILG